MLKHSEAGKGSSPRKTLNLNAYSAGWDRIFGDNHGDETKVETQKTTQPVCCSCSAEKCRKTQKEKGQEN